MKIAVTYQNGEVFQHFGHSEEFKIYTVENNKIIDAAVVNTNGNGHGALAQFLKDHDVNALICGGIGGGAKNALAQAGITLYAGTSGKADEKVEQLLAGTLQHNPDTMCNHHHEHGEHHGNCGDHGCGGDHHCHHE